MSHLPWGLLASSPTLLCLGTAAFWSWALGGPWGHLALACAFAGGVCLGTSWVRQAYLDDLADAQDRHDREVDSVHAEYAGFRRHLARGTETLRHVVAREESRRGNRRGKQHDAN